MKKHVLAWLPFGVALASTVQAQVGPTGGAAVTSSSVALFGVVDVALAWGRGSLSDQFRLTSGALNTSNIGLRGTEELGGGLGVGFWLEAGFGADNGTGQSTNTNNQASGSAGSQGLVFNRRSTVSLMGNWGEIRLGRDFTATYRNRDQTDPFTTAGVGATQVDVGSIAGVTTARASNMIGYFLPPRLGGFFGEAQYFMGEQPSNVVNDRDGDGAQVRLGYAAGPFAAAAAWGITRYATTPVLGDTTVWNIGAHYAFDFGRLTAGYFRDEVESAPALRATGWIVGGVFPIGPHVLRASYSSYQSDEASSPATRKLAVGGIYNLSMRTAAYLTYAHVDNRGSAATSLNGSTTAPGNGSSGVDLGLRHRF